MDMIVIDQYNININNNNNKGVIILYRELACYVGDLVVSSSRHLMYVAGRSLGPG